METLLEELGHLESLRRKKQAEKDRPGIRSITSIYSDSQDWRLKEGSVELRTHRE
jgi:hypothetical protein